MLYGERLVCRIEAAVDRKTGTLIEKNIWFEDGVRQTKKLTAAIDGAIGRFAKFNDCAGIKRSL